jgi:hypothetical protein
MLEFYRKDIVQSNGERSYTEVEKGISPGFFTAIERISSRALYLE